MKKLLLGLFISLLSVSSFAVEEISDKTALNKIKVDGLVVLDMYATWCGPCKKYAPMIEQAEKDFAGQITFYKVDIDKNPIMHEAFKVDKIPTTLVFYKGHLAARIVGGAISYDEVKSLFQKIVEGKNKYEESQKHKQGQ